MKRSLLVIMALLVLFPLLHIATTAAEEEKPEEVHFIKGVKFLLHPGALKVATTAGVRIDLKTGFLYTPTGKVKEHDLTKEGVSEVSLYKNDHGNLQIIAVWPNGIKVFMECARGTVIDIGQIWPESK